MEFITLENKKAKDEEQLREQMALDLLKGFSSNPKYMSSMYLYDDEGSRLFSKIMEQEEYYPTNCEYQTLNLARKEIADTLPNKLSVVELGAGDGKKMDLLLQELVEKKIEFEYIPVDISRQALLDLEKNLGSQLDPIPTTAIVGEYFDAIEWISQNRAGPKLIMFLGGNIGNFDRPSAITFLRVLWNACNHGDYLISGFDLKKDIGTMTRAYNDENGVTRAFNLNLLTRLNHELGAEFKLDQFEHYGFYNPTLGGMESYLISLKDQEVYVAELQKTFQFRAYEPIHLEYSYKYLKDEINSLANDTGYAVVEHFTDEKSYFVDSFWRVEKELKSK
jgi:dimethylhistidine N-methyltransferase